MHLQLLYRAIIQGKICRPQLLRALLTVQNALVQNALSKSNISNLSGQHTRVNNLLYCAFIAIVVSKETDVQYAKQGLYIEIIMANMRERNYYASNTTRAHLQAKQHGCLTIQQCAYGQHTGQTDYGNLH
ncbi:hypothetical protein FGO68_gene14770 [Halteria grandinella]|uniref:Uncharacterized protein n=1 Tax=Halteria grandinella TaxID=5974 RepID=A0A8J8N917_HALGN|nr:hypothetical protein FGO68_gene14770 [Halteria grandinella]